MTKGPNGPARSGGARWAFTLWSAYDELLGAVENVLRLVDVEVEATTHAEVTWREQ